jgi:hypothetical protein
MSGAGRGPRAVLVLVALVIATLLPSVVDLRGGLALLSAAGLAPVGPAGSLGTQSNCTAANQAAAANQTPCVATAAPTAIPTPVPTAAGAGVAYSHSWYIVSPDDLPRLGKADAEWLNAETSGSACPRNFLTVLDFGHPSRKYNTNVSPLDDYAMTLFGYQDAWQTYRQVEQLAERYIDAWMAVASRCLQLHLVLGTNNYAQCGEPTGACSQYTAGQYWDVVVHDVQDYVSAQAYNQQVVAVWVGDDIETSWDPWPATERFLAGVRDQELTYSTHARLVDYGDADIGACSIVTNRCNAPWTADNVYTAAWGSGWDVPLPETYSTTTANRWLNVANSPGDAGPMSFLGVMTECGEADPLPTGSCSPAPHGQSAEQPSPTACEWAPTYAFGQIENTDAGKSLTYATNIQWPDETPTSQSGGQSNDASSDLIGLTPCT